ncbi:VPA1269 family protein [Rhizobium laguerreae]|uniref:VPA1269 family protein n=1 Tax=Rhizobium laguerreae TaxID=1076926 RepID=UPI001C9284C4|nr:VPA1269 family protein [Rhizobium laguerreae]MBY3369065.1 hypothetical protein [Rhizobium laguerreae]
MKVEQNLGLEPYYHTGEIEELLSFTLSNILNIPKKVRAKLHHPMYRTYDDYRNLLTSSALDLVKANQHGDFRISYIQFGFGQSGQIPNIVADVVLSETSLGRDVMSRLDARNAVDLIRGTAALQTADNYERMFRSLIACLVLTCSGARSLPELGADRVRSFLQLFYSPEERSFNRPDIFGSAWERWKKVLKVVAKLLGVEMNDQAITEMGLQSRTGPVGEALAHAIFETPSPHYEKWISLWKSWRETQPPIVNAPFGALAIMLQWLDQFEQTDVADPVAFLQTKRRVSVVAHTMDERKVRGLQPITDNVADGIAKLFAFSNFLNAELKPRASKGWVPLVSAKDHQHFQNEKLAAGKGGKNAEAASVPLPMRFYRAFKELLEEGEHGWPGTYPRCRYVVNGEVVYNPTLPNIYRVLIEIPERVVQIRRLDSGEGDLKRYNAYKKRWVDNTGPHSGYWKANGDKLGYRGYARKTKSGVTGIYINTNKTGKPFVIPWEGEAVHKILYEQRLFQEKWNPIRGPVPPSVYLDQSGRAEKGSLSRYPAIYPLFRMPPDSMYPGNIPVRFDEVNDFWLAAMWQLQQRYNASVPDNEKEYFVTLSDDGKTPIRCDFNSHGMRVAGLTLLLQAGMPLEIVSKLLAGHKTLLMTLYYIKFDPALIDRTMDQIALERDKLIRADCFLEMKKADAAEVKRRMVANSPEVLSYALQESGGRRHLWQERDQGICMADGKRCDDGGPCVRREITKGGVDKSKYSKVEGGEGNCLLCRHFMTGPRFAFAIREKGTALLRLLAKQAGRINDLIEEQDAVETLLGQMSTTDPRRVGLRKDVNDILAQINTITNQQADISLCFDGA